MSKTSPSPTTTNPMSPALVRRAPTHPGEIFKLEYRDPIGLSQAEAARRLEMPLNRLNEFEKGKRGVALIAADGYVAAILDEPAAEPRAVSRLPEAEDQRRAEAG